MQFAQAVVVRVVDLMVLAFGTSMPFSMIFVATRTSYSWLPKSMRICSISFGASCPWATAMRASGTSPLDEGGEVLNVADAGY